MSLSLHHLPEEILYHILSYCPPTTCAALNGTASYFHGVSNEPRLWRLYCQRSFQHWDPRHDLPVKLAGPVAAVEWKELYVARHRVDRTTRHLLDGILAEQTGRMEKFRALVELGCDVKDTLLRNCAAESRQDDVLARTYYARALLNALHRNMAVPQWARLRRGDPVSLEQALGTFDLFLPESTFGGLEEISARLDEIAGQIARADPEFDHRTSRVKAKAVLAYLRGNGLTGMDGRRGYLSIDHNFLGLALQDPGHNSLPLVSAVLYCAVARRLGLDARPCGIPFHVYVTVVPTAGYDMDDNVLEAGAVGAALYLDPFRSSRETPVGDLHSQLALLGASPAQQRIFLSGSRTAEIVLRCSQSISDSVNLQVQLPGMHLPAPVDLNSARYAALWASMLLLPASRSQERRDQLPWFLELFATEFPCDLYLVERHLAPLFVGTVEHEQILRCLHVIRAVDEIPRPVKRRTAEHSHIQYRVGEVFRHQRYGYTGIITGWDTECDAGERWMRRMGVDRLAGGRHQSFYHVLVEDKSVRYVAEENITRIRPHEADLPPTLIAIAGKHFKRWDDDRCVFISNITDEYPDD